jgi:hypothetical protein
MISVTFYFSSYFEKLLTKAILALNDQKTIEPLKMMVEQEQESKSQFLYVVRTYVYIYIKHSIITREAPTMHLLLLN